MSDVKKKPRRSFLRGHFLLAAAVIGFVAGTVFNTKREQARAEVDPEKDRITAVFSPPGDPVLTKPYYVDYETESAMFARHHMMMQDTANVRELKTWLSQLDPVLDAPPLVKLEALRKLVQDSIKYAPEERLYNCQDYLAPPLQTIRAHFGDCDDFASVFYIGARYLRFPADKCFLMAVGTTGYLLKHWVAVVDTSASSETALLSQNMFILDNGGPIKHIEETGFVPMTLVNREGSHIILTGFRKAFSEVREDIRQQGLEKYVHQQMEKKEVKQFLKDYFK